MLFLGVGGEASPTCPPESHHLRWRNFKQDAFDGAFQQTPGRHCTAPTPSALRFIDALLADLSGIPRGKRVTMAELEQIYDGGFALSTFSTLQSSRGMSVGHRALP